ncbi:MAG: FAD-dependent monooxygenase [Chloroflexota bacterium]
MQIRVVIVGGGLGGLVTALLLRKVGIEVAVYEKVDELREVGAGIVVPPNMVRPLELLGLGEQLATFAVKLEAAWEFRRWKDGNLLFSQPMGEACRRLYGTDCYVAHRGDLLAMYKQALPENIIHLDHQCIHVNELENEIELTFINRAGQEKRVTADVVIGADGIHSAVRTAVTTPTDPQFSGSCAFRCLVPAEKAPAMALRPVQAIWLGPGRHFVHYPISGGKLVNVVAIVPAGEWRTESWIAEGKIEDLFNEFESWDSRLHQLIQSATETKRWALYDRVPLERWCKGRIALLGDAAHAMLPYFAQGSAQATEDGVVLAACLQDATPGSVPEALQRYETIRQPRANEVQLMSRGREVRNHLPDGPEQQKRDQELASGNLLLKNGWLYGHELGFFGI